MAAEWTRWCRSRDFEVQGDDVLVTCAARQQTVTVLESDDAFELMSVVARHAVVHSQDDLPVKVWLRNRGTPLVGFRIDAGGRLIAEAWVPKAGLTSAEFHLYLRAVAEESDRFEFQLTGKDLE